MNTEEMEGEIMTKLVSTCTHYSLAVFPLVLHLISILNNISNNFNSGKQQKLSILDGCEEERSSFSFHSYSQAHSLVGSV